MALRRAALLPLAAFLAWQALAGVCQAEIVFLSSGRTMNVKSHRADGDRVVLTLRGGGEVTCEASVIDHIGPDEVPYPEPEPVVVVEPAALSPVPYADLIDRAATQHGVDVRLVRAVIQVESAYQAQARSRKGAVGLMQLMPDTARRYAVTNLYDPGSNIDAGIQHLKMLIGRFAELSLALAAYNAGEAAVERFRGIPPYPETQNYVRQVLRLLGPVAVR
jgi:soluble lytic murein transglycosylase-like protein